MKKQIVVITLKYGLGLGLLVWVLWTNWHQESADGQEVGIAGVFQRNIDWWPLFLAFLIGACSVLLTFVRWFVLVRALDLPFTFYNAVRLGLLGVFFSSFLPGSVTGDIPKAAFLARAQSRRTAAVATVIMDRVLGLCGLVWLVALIGTLYWFAGSLDGLAQTTTAQIFLRFIVQVSLCLVVASLTFWVVLGLLPADRASGIASRIEGIPKLGGALAELWRSVLMYRVRGESVLMALLLAMVGHIGFVFIFYLCSQALNPPEKIPSLGAHFLIVPVGMTIQAGFPTPGGLGGGEAAFSWLYAQVGAGGAPVSSATTTSAEGFLTALGNRVLFWIISFLGYLIYLGMRPERNFSQRIGSHDGPAGLEDLPRGV